MRRAEGLVFQASLSEFESLHPRFYGDAIQTVRRQAVTLFLVSSTLTHHPSFRGRLTGRTPASEVGNGGSLPPLGASSLNANVAQSGRARG